MGIIPQKLIDKGRYWTKAWSLVEGCTPVSEACDNCWLAAIAQRFQQKWKDGTPLTENGKFYGQVAIREDRLKIPLKARKQQVFAIWSDLFHPAVPDRFIKNVYETISDDTHTFLILTKRPERLSLFYDSHRDALQFSGILNNIWHGTTVENQEQADKRIPELLKVPGKKFLSIEPLLGKINLAIYEHISQVICGGETGHNARPCDHAWVRSLRDQCADAGVPFFFKGFGSGGRKRERLLDGRTHDNLAWND